MSRKAVRPTMTNVKLKNNGLYGIKSKTNFATRRTSGNNQNRMLFFRKLETAVIVVADIL